MVGFFLSLDLKVLDMKVFKLMAFVGVMAMSLSALAEGGGDRTFERALSANVKAMEQYAADQGKPAPVVKDYEYGMKLDVVKVVSVVRPQVACAVVPTAMTYEDSKGQLNTIKYTVAGDCRNGGS
ncbi:Protein of unknown function (DUF2790) [Pseudomonas sp. GM18]|nr:Protein of unknown function (DUF2790) [Pseudomonas sp. GM18]